MTISVINANQALKLSKRYQKNELTPNRVLLMNCIKENADKGLTSFVKLFYTNLEIEAFKEDSHWLRMLGYKITLSKAYACYAVSWGSEE